MNSATEESKILRLKNWASEFPGSEEHLPALLNMRRGPLKDFVDNFLVPFVRSEEFIANMNANFDLDDLINKNQSQHSEEPQSDPVCLEFENKMETINNAQDSIFKSCSEKFQNLNFSTSNPILKREAAQNKELELIRQEEILLKTVTLISKLKELKISQDLDLTCTEHQTTDFAKSINFDPNEINCSLDKINKDLTEALKLTVKDVTSPLIQKIRHEAYNKLRSLYFSDKSFDFLLASWWKNKVEQDKNKFHSTLQAILKDESDSPVKKVVDSAMSTHIQYAKQNIEKEEYVSDLKFKLEDLISEIPSRLQATVKQLIMQKKREMKVEYYTKIDQRLLENEMDSYFHAGLTDSSSSCLNENNEDELIGHNNFSQDLKFDLTCSLFKAWPFTRELFWKTLEEESDSVKELIEESSNLKFNIEQE